jgi:hypothetical protein
MRPASDIDPDKPQNGSFPRLFKSIRILSGYFSVRPLTINDGSVEQASSADDLSA